MHRFLDCIISTITFISKNPCRTPSTNSRAMCSQAAFRSPPSEASVSIWMLFNSRIVEERLHALDGGSESERANLAALTVESDHVIAPGWPVLKHKDLAPAFGAQVEQIVADAAQKT